MPPIETPTEPNPPSSAPQPVKVVAGRYGELEAHELVYLLDSIEDERARGRFRESLYISIFVWIAIAWFIFYGPRYLWHAPQLRDPASVLRERELTELRMPAVPRAPALKNAPPVHTTIDKSTMNHLREMAARRPAAPAPAALPNAPQPQPATPAAPPPPPPVANTPQPHTPPPPVADAPTMQPQKPNFGTQSSAGSAIREAMNDAAHSRGGTDLGGGGRSSGRSSPLNFGGVEITSDTQGVDFGPYIRRILGDIKRNWDPLIPAEAEAPLYKQGESYIRFSINPDGTIKEMHLDGSTHDEAINRSCWGSITSEGQFPPLPSQFHGPNLELRIHYLVNKEIPQ